MAPPMSRIAPLSALLGLSAVLTGHALRTSQSAASDVHKASSRNLHAYTFRDFVAEFSRTYEEGTEQWAMRKELFTESLKDAVEFNSKPGRSWQKGVTKFMDYTEAERKRVLGYTGRGSRQHTGVPANAVAFASGRAMDLPSEFSVERPGTKLINIVREQGNCGSCWAEAATATLEGQLEANETIMAALGRMHAKSSSQVPEVPTLSSQMIVSCTPNPRNCGGTGGCGGATVELAYDMIKGNAGLPFAVEWGYESGNSGQAPACKKDLFPKAQVAITGYNALPSNRLLPLQEALVKSGGPVAVSVDATNWFVYAGGIFSDLDFGGKGDFTVNHAVTLVGYKEPEDGASGYWVIKNSWGPYWGESGKIRLEMKEDEGNHCGWDRKTHDGVACDGDPDQAWVCGTCGILYDSVYPTGVHLKTA